MTSFILFNRMLSSPSHMAGGTYRLEEWRRSLNCHWLPFFKIGGRSFRTSLTHSGHKLNGNFDNTNRHTIFIPLYTDWYTDPCLTSGSGSNKGDVTGIVSELPEKGVRLRIGPSTTGDIMVTDGNATDDKYAELLVPPTPNGYDVWLSGKGKPGGCLDIDAYLVDSTTYYFIGHVDVDRKTGAPTWQNAKWLLYGSGGTAYFADPNDLYFWQLYNNGLRLMQVRFYPTAS